LKHFLQTFDKSRPVFFLVAWAITKRYQD
jgi:hypothetical protein